MPHLCHAIKAINFFFPSKPYYCAAVNNEAKFIKFKTVKLNKQAINQKVKREEIPMSEASSKWVLHRT